MLSHERYMKIRNEIPTILSRWLNPSPQRIDYFPPIQRWSSVISLMRFGDRIAAAERVRDKKGPRLLYFTGALSKIIILSEAVRISLIPWTGEVERGWSKPAECRRKGWIAGVHCGVWSALLALSTVSTSANRRFCRLPFLFRPLTQARLFATSTRLSLNTPRCSRPSQFRDHLLSRFIYYRHPAPRFHCHHSFPPISYE